MCYSPILKVIWVKFKIFKIFICYYIYIFFLVLGKKYIKVVKIQKSYTKAKNEPLQAGYLIVGLICALVTNLDYLEVFINYFNDSIVNNNVEVLINNGKLSFILPETVPIQDRDAIIQSLESTDGLILNKLRRIDYLLENGISDDDNSLEDPDSSLSFCVNRLKTLQSKYKYL